MMGILSKFGYVESKGLAIAGGNDLALPFFNDNDQAFDAFVECWEQGMITEERLDEAVKRVLAAQSKTLREPKYTEVTEEDRKIFNRISTDGIFASLDEGLTAGLEKGKKYYFAIMSRPETNIDGNKPGVDTFSNGWYFVDRIAAHLLEEFPKSKVRFFHEFPTQGQCYNIVEESLKCDDTIFFSFVEPLAYTGPEGFTHRFVNLIKAMQLTNRISTILHFGNPLMLESLVHIPRVLIGGNSEASVNAAIDVLAGKNEAKGVLTCNVDLK